MDQAWANRKPNLILNEHKYFNTHSNTNPNPITS